MAIISMPAGVAFVDADWTLATPAQNNRSAWTGARRIARLPGPARWKVKATGKPVVADDAMTQRWRAFLAALDGMINSFYIPVSSRPQHGYTITPVVKTGAVAGANQFTIQGLPASTALLKAGQFITPVLPSGKSQLLLLTADLVSNSGGEALATFAPVVREAPAAGASIELKYPYCEVALTSPEVRWVESRGQRVDFVIDAEEAF